jgi:hypothetical protein
MSPYLILLSTLVIIIILYLIQNSGTFPKLDTNIPIRILKPITTMRSRLSTTTSAPTTFSQKTTSVPTTTSASISKPLPTPEYTGIKRDVMCPSVYDPVKCPSAEKGVNLFDQIYNNSCQASNAGWINCPKHHDIFSLNNNMFY